MLDLAPWITLTRRIRVRSDRAGRGAVALSNDSSGGWSVHATVGGIDYRGYVPGVVTWREAERCATRLLRRVLTKNGGTA